MTNKHGLPAVPDDSQPDIPRGTYIGRPADGPPAQQGDHLVKCPACSGWIDCRDLGSVFAHAGPLPHPAGDLPQ